ncbi:MAG: ATP-binding protein [Halothece sp. Uz-M2-17]|nr:ATP-binding protein [Halothece sp. Uz-M2-17]
MTQTSRQWKKLFIFNLRWRGGIMIALPVLCLLTAILMIAGLRSQTANARTQEQKSQSILNAANGLLMGLQQAEAEVRGYSVTQNQKFLSNYQQAQTTIENQSQQLQQLAQESSIQQTQVQKIQQLAQQQINHLKTTIEISQEATLLGKSFSELDQQLLKNERQFEQLESAIAQFIEQQQTAQAQREAQVEDWKNLTTQVQWLALIVGLGATTGAIYLFINLDHQLSQYTDRIEESNAYLARTTQTLEKRNQELDQFAYIVSHDLKAPLRAIANLSSWIEEDLEEKLDPEIQHQMDLLRGRVHRMEAFINGILEYSRVGRMRSQIETVDVKSLLTEIIDSLAPPADFTIELSSPMPIVVTDPLPLQQIFTNLISNAIKHHHRSDGKVFIVAKELETAYEFSIHDDGPGIDPKFHEKIFVMFQTLQARDTVENTGVGLAIIKKILDDKGGTIKVESESENGTTFRFTWPKQ